MANSAIIAGGGPGGLYTAWRLLTDSNSTFNSVTVLEMSSERVGGRIHTQTFQNSNYVDLGGMRFANTQQVINQVIDRINFDRSAVTDFVEADVRMLHLRGETVYSNSINGDLSQPAPYNTPYNSKVVDTLFNNVSQEFAGGGERTRTQWCQWIENAVVPESYQSRVYDPGTKVANVGYWNLLYDAFNDIEAYHYCADAGGYQSNVINWNAADAIPYNGEFGANVRYLRFRGGYTKFIDALHEAVIQNYNNKDPVILNKRVISFDFNDSTKQIDVKCEPTYGPGDSNIYSADYLFLCMPRRSVELIGQAAGDDTLAKHLNNSGVKLYLESVIEQPSYKIGVSCNASWFDNCSYPPKLDTPDGAWGPTVTDLPLRQIYYFTPEEQVKGTNYAILASYDDMRYTDFWRQFELNTAQMRTTPLSEDYQPLSKGTPLTEEMKRMVALQLAHVHYNTSEINSGYNQIYNSITEGYYMDWSLNPFGAGYHAWDAHYEICDVMQRIRKPLAIANSGLPGADQVFLAGSAYSNDQAWVEGAFCTAESVLTEYLNFSPLVNTATYPLICGCS